MPKTVRVGIRRRLGGVELVALGNRTRPRAQLPVGKLGIPGVVVVGDWQMLIGSGRCDVISIGTRRCCGEIRRIGQLDVNRPS